MERYLRLDWSPEQVAEAYHEGNHLDACKQVDKAVHLPEGVREGYAKQGYSMKDVRFGKLKPAEAEACLKELGHNGGLPDFMEKVSGQFASFKWARKA